jgi:hypothetical protein
MGDVEIVVKQKDGQGLPMNLEDILATALELRLKAMRGGGEKEIKRAKWGELREYLEEYRDIRGF